MLQAVGDFCSGYEQTACDDNALFSNAFNWLSERFGEVHPDEIYYALARDIKKITEWEQGCLKCTDAAQCQHSRAICEVLADVDSHGRRRFVVGARPCDKVKKNIQISAAIDAFDHSLIPSKRRDNTFDNFRASGDARAKLLAAKGTAAECVAHNCGLILGGSVGCGKTHLAIATGLEMLQGGHSVRFYLLPELLEELRTERWNHESAMLDDAKRCDWLILDDAGTEKNSNGTTNWKDELFFTVINYRYDHKLPVVITTNAVGKGGLQSALQGGNGERIFSRLMEMTAQVWMTNVPDFRQIKKRGAPE